MLPSRTPSAAARPLVIVAVVLLLAALTAFVTLRLDDSQAAPSRASGGEVADQAPPAVVPAALAPALPSSCATAEELIPVTAMRCDLNQQRPGAPTLVVWGDSHAWQMVPALQAAVAGQGINLVGFLFGSCPVMDPALASQKGDGSSSRLPPGQLRWPSTSCAS